MERITFEVTAKTKEKLKIKSAKHKSLKEYMTILVEQHLSEDTEMIDFQGLKVKTENEKNNIENKITGGKNKPEPTDFIEYIFLDGQIHLLETILEMKGK